MALCLSNDFRAMLVLIRWRPMTLRT